MCDKVDAKLNRSMHREGILSYPESVPELTNSGSAIFSEEARSERTAASQSMHDD